ncbi:hypothetical protein BG011_006044 [Mortierella polycephala]|uniref:Uncharacterized protein n=1 Tax=Mortierella polycephala TaxID=41804 RepID=A0A9P6PX51_9FUNG|nr:hypothetical protein BG011_006044 [Mortierella polycephala]
MDTDHSSKSPPMPSKLRWRPYANGTSKKNKQLPKSATSNNSKAPNPKAIAHKMRGTQYYSGKAPHPPVELKLQWEEAETIESMRHGGHPQNQHHSESGSDHSRGSSPSASSVTSSTSSSGTANKIGNSNTSNPFSYAMQRAMASLPSPPASKLPLTRLDLVGGQSDLTQFKASVSGLTCNASTQDSDHSLTALTSSNAYQIALNALLHSQNYKNPSVFHTPALTANSSVSTTANATSPAAASVPVTSTAALLGSSTINNVLTTDPDRALSNQELLTVATIEELLATYGYVDNTINSFDSLLNNQTAQMLASPISTVQSSQSSPMGGSLDFNNHRGISRGSSPSSGSFSFSPMAVSGDAFEVLLTQPPASSLQTPSSASPDNSGAPVAGNPYNNFLQELASPFGYLSTNGDPLLSNNAPSAWPSLFPTVTEDRQMPTQTTITTAAKVTPQRTEIATQTDLPYEPSLSPQSVKTSAHNSPQSTLGLSDEELDPEWLNFLDEAGPIFDEIDMQSPPPLGDESLRAKDTQRNRTIWSWAEELIKPNAMSPTGNRNIPPSVPSMGGISGNPIASGGLIRTLQGTHQQKSNKSRSMIPKKDISASSHKADSAEHEENKCEPKNPKESSRTEESINVKNDGGFGGLVVMIRNLWVGKSGGDGNVK